jgi:alkylation response protein AidB-like acyl-CoA dehydrogenase
VYLDYTPEQKALRDELRVYFTDLMTPEVRAAVGFRGEGGPAWRKVVAQMGRDGWLGIGWPTEYGGQGRPATDQFIFYDEAQRLMVPVPFVTLNTVGPTLMQYGSAAQKERFLPQILAGVVNFAIGYTESAAGTDLASLQTRAVRDGDEYVISGSKMFTSGANDADWLWLACRTDPDAKKHKGISMILVPTAAEGFSWSLITTVGDMCTTATYYDEVRVPVTNLVGEENAGWRMITTQLNHERVGLAAFSGEAHELFAGAVEWAASTPCDDGVVIDLPWVRSDLGACHARLEAMKLLNWKLASAVADGDLNAADASAAKVFGTEAVIEVYHRLLGVLGAVGVVRGGSPGAVLHGRIEQAGRAAQINTFGGGVNEIQREIVAWMGLGLTRGAR